MLAFADILLMEKCQGLICGPGLMRMARFRPILTEVLFAHMQPENGVYDPLIDYIPLK